MRRPKTKTGKCAHCQRRRDSAKIEWHPGICEWQCSDFSSCDAAIAVNDAWAALEAVTDRLNAIGLKARHLKLPKDKRGGGYVFGGVPSGRPAPADGIGVLEHGFMIDRRDGQWVVTVPGKGQLDEEYVASSSGDAARFVEKWSRRVTKSAATKEASPKKARR